ncbi:hypothetical protein BU23DRAFT_568397 [Bimuria novae-zelandiae CBS 107.79]|uniref:2EXR domain-containing protein n=1 Tax=Bimuria novae-zelandiae CBS 107.79 TaxID=1447943 RepID=A0A6A5V9P2_9PLEO|nr:hypothetical protein BU23DRAFT_568397 [Bimuria novae-zelandiae CBS 107.79]
MFPFLKLPAELRNRVYNFVATPATDPIHISHPKNDVHKIDSQKEKARSMGTYAALTRVCSQIRKEYLPLHQEQARVSLDYDDLDDYMRTFFMLERPGKLLRINVSSHINQSQHHYVNILRLLRAQACVPNFECRAEWTGTDPPVDRDEGLAWRTARYAYAELKNHLDNHDANWMVLLRENSYSITDIHFLAIHFRFGSATTTFVLNPKGANIPVLSRDSMKRLLDYYGFLRGRLALYLGLNLPPLGFEFAWENHFSFV